MQNDSFIIGLKQEIATSIGSRDAVLALKKQIQNHYNQAILDFTGIDFISRAAAHEFLLLEDSLKEDNISLEFRHQIEDVSKMMDVVRKSRLAPKAKQPLKFKRMDAKSFFAMRSK